MRAGHAPAVQAKPQNGAPAPSASPASVQQRLGEGEAMALEVTSRFSRAYGHDLSDVRLHRDSPAASALGARAVTVGRDVAFAPGEYKPGTPAGDRLIGHELAHVVQQAGGAGAVQGAGLGSDGYEREADRAADAALRGGRPSLSALDRTSVQRDPSPAEAQTPAAKTPPVIWGFDSRTNRIYVSVRAPARPLVEVASYVYGSPEPAGRLASENGVEADPIAPGRTLRLVEGHLSDAAHRELNAALESGLVTRTEGIPSTSSTETTLYRFVANGQSFDLTDAQLRGMIAGTKVALGRRAQALRSAAEGLLGAQRHHVSESNSVVRAASDWWGNAELPQESVFTGPMDAATSLTRDLGQAGTGDVIADARRVPEMAQRLKSIAESVDAADRAWRRYINATIEGAEGVEHGLEIVRDVSFGMAIGLGAVVAFPVVAGSAAVVGTLGTGTAATIGAGGIVVASGGAVGAALRGGTSVVGQAISRGSVDWSDVGRESWQGARRGAVDAFVGLVAPGISAGASRVGAAGLARVFGADAMTATTASLGRSLAGRMLLQAGAHVPGASLVGGLHAGLTTATTGKLSDVPQAVLRGLLIGALFGAGGALANTLLARLVRLLPPSFSFRPRMTGYHGTTSEAVPAFRAGTAELRGDSADDFGAALYASRNPEYAAYTGGRRLPEGVTPEMLDVSIPLRWRDVLRDRLDRAEEGSLLAFLRSLPRGRLGPAWEKLVTPSGPRAFLSLLDGKTGRAWDEFMSAPAVPGSLSTKAEAFMTSQAEFPGGVVLGRFSEMRSVWYEQFLKEQGLAASPPGIVEGWLPQNAPGATQIAIKSAEVLAMINEALRYNPRGVAQLVEGIVGGVPAKPVNRGNSSEPVTP